MAELTQIVEFLTLSATYPVIDVRSPGEYNQGHIPGAINIPLFNDHERKQVGTLYKQINKEAAMYAGLDFAGKKLVELAREGEKKSGNSRTLLVHCWRGGMRSKSMVWLFETVGIRCYLLEGGYKSYRRHIHHEFSQPLALKVIGGLTGSGKTEILKQLEQDGDQVLDLEGLAHHKGSAFGALGESEQPTTEQFENELGKQISLLDKEKEVWIEDESKNVGKCVIPDLLYNRMQECLIVFLNIDRKLRARHLVKHYASYDSEALKGCILRIQKKLGGDRTKEAMDSVNQKDFYNTALITLQYYDKAYMHSLEKNHKHWQKIDSDSIDPAVNASLIKNRFKT